MPTFIIFALLSLTLVAAVFVSRFAYHRQHRRETLSWSTKQYVDQAAVCYELAEFANEVGESNAIANTLVDASIRHYQRVLDIDPQAKVQTALDEARELSRRIQSQGARNLSKLLSSGRKVGLARLRLKHVERVLKTLCEAGEVDASDYAEYHHELMWLYLKIEAQTLIDQGNLSSNQDNKIQARVYYQRALNALKKSALNDPRKLNLIKELSELLAKQKLAMSAESEIP